MCTFSLENGTSNYQCTVNKGLILPQYMLLLCPCPHSMVKRASVQPHKSFCSIFSHVECICQGPEVRKKKGIKKRGRKRKKKQNWGLFRTHGIWSFLGERSLIWEAGRRKVEMFQTQYSACKSHMKTFFVALAFSEMGSFLIAQSSSEAWFLENF